MTTPHAHLSPDDVRRIGTLARLALSPGQVEQYRGQLGDILAYVQRLSDLDLSGLEPMAHVGDEINRLADDTPGGMLPTADLMKMAPVTTPPFLQVPKVLGEGGA